MITTVVLLMPLLVGISSAHSTLNNVEEEIQINMPGVHPEKDDEYWCYAYHLSEETKYITQFEANAEGSIAHHILMYGCQAPYSNGRPWKCGSNICDRNSISKILFAWARNAPPTKMPKDVGFEIGGDSGVNYIVLQIHYRRKFASDESADESGMKLTVSSTPQRYKAGVILLLSTQLVIPAHAKKVHSNISCQYDGGEDIHPFAFRTHAHSLATVISGYKYNDSFHLLGKGNPQWPQAFYPMSNVETIKPQDFMIAQCTYDNSNSDKTTHIGATHNDEMCNFYMMYYTESNIKDTFLECYDDERPDLSKRMPAGSDVPPPVNKDLEDIGEGHHHHHAMEGEDELPNFIPYKAVSLKNNWPPEEELSKVTLGQVGGMAVDSQGNLHVFHRGSREWGPSSFSAANEYLGDKPISEHTLLTFNTEGKLIDQWGKDMFYMPHGLYIDADDNMWVTDVALHQVMRFPKGSKKPDIVLGEKLKRGNDKEHFCKPTDVTVLTSREVFITDGYCNHRVMKFTKDGKFIKEWGTHSQSVGDDNFPPPNTFDLPHSITDVPNHNSVCVADRENGRIQCFDYEGKFIKQIHIPEFGGRLFALTYCPELDLLYCVNGEQPYKSSSKVSGFTIGYTSGLLLESWKPGNQEFKRPHDIVIANNGKDLYVGEIGPNIIWKFNVDTKQYDTEHKSVKRPGPSDDTVQPPHHPVSVDSSSGDVSEKKIEKSQEPDFGVSIVIGTLLIVPVLVLVIIVVFLRVRKRSAEIGYKLVLPEEDGDYDSEDDLWVKSTTATKKVSFKTLPTSTNGKSTSTYFQ